MLIRHLDTPEFRLEVVPKESLSFSTTPRSVLVSGENALEANPPVPRGLPCDTPKMGNPEKWSTPRSVLQVPENRESGKTGRSPEGDLETPWQKS